MNTRRPLFALLAGVALLLLLSVTFLSTSPPPAESELSTSASRELDEAAEEVRAVATGMRRLEQKISDQALQIRELGESFAQMGHRVEQLAQHQRRQGETLAAAPPRSPPDDSMQSGEAFNLDSLTQSLPADSTTDSAGTPRARSLVWVEPLDGGGTFRQSLEMVSADLVASTEAGESPRFYIPPAILSGLSLTALVGRIPRGGAVQDPWPFVAISQNDNLTANGMRLPGLRGILWRGVVRGDAVLSCASASVRSLVYVFDDGTFHVAKAPEQEGFGYLADKFGNPCLQGEIHTTAPESMGTHLLASVLAGMGGAFAESQVQRNTSAGTETTHIEGDAFSYLLGETVQGAASTYGDYLLRFANDTWDAVVVPAGREVDIHVTDAIPITHSPTRRIYDDPAPFSAVAFGGLD
ncbi:MAG: hypothetical protein OXG03_02855 [Gammaproteobacteria bacterium]|nr:hypothetical protein [Gammaproteobacteria bacterium]